MPLSTGTRLGPYEIIALVGVGAWGKSTAQRDTRLDRAVAIEVLASHLAASAEPRQRFEHEACAMPALSHPHICVVHTSAAMTRRAAAGVSMQPLRRFERRRANARHQGDARTAEPIQVLVSWNANR